jgi:pyruvate/2-oxoglutarate/acetoin dehydrogenase E1 component
MSQPEYTPYKDALSNAMGQLAKLNNSIFIGQQIIYAGNPMSTTLGEVPKEKMVELPVMEETQMGMTLGIAMTDKLVISFYPRWDFIICAANQLINHIDKYEMMTGKTAHIIIRLGKGSDKPLDPGHQHKGNYFEEFKSICKNIEFMDLKTPIDIELSYKYATKNKGIYVLVEYPELYYKN